MYAAKALTASPAEVVVVDRRNCHVFQPLLYQVATGGLSPGDIAAPLRAVLARQKNSRVLMGEAVDFDVPGRRLILESGEIAYDTLIVATGATHSYFGHNHWELYAPGLKTVEDALEIRKRVLMAFEAAEREMDPERRREWLTFVIVGAGPTGVELAGALGEIANDTLKGNFRDIRPEEARILLIDAAPRVLPGYPEKLSACAERDLIKLSVRFITGTVEEVNERGVRLRCGNGERRIEARTILWAAGVQASPLGRLLAERTGAGTDRSGRVLVNSDLCVPGHPEILVIGDLAHFEQDGKPLPGVAPVAMQQGEYAARLVNARLRGRSVEPFRYRDKGSLATIGRHAAVADFGWLRFGGPIAWLAWLFIHLLYLVGFESRVVVLIQWAFQYFTFNRGARLITGPVPPLPEVRLGRPGGRASEAAGAASRGS